MYCDAFQLRGGRRMRKKILLILVALVAFESFGFGFLLDAAKLAIGVSVMVVQNIRNCGRTSSANAPKIVSVTPDDGAKDVDPNLGEIVVCFDRPMQGRVSLTGDGWPTLVGTPEFDSAMTNLTIRVVLKPETEYSFGFNSRNHKKFASADGVPLTPCVYSFRTK